MVKKKNHKNVVKKEGYQGATFGIMEAVIMILGVLIGLSTTGNKSIVIIGIVTAGIADAFGNSGAFYVSEESEGVHTKKEVWKSTMWCLIGTVVTVLILLIPLIIFDLPLAIYVGFGVGIVVLLGLAWFVAKYQNFSMKSLMVKYVVLGISVAIATFIVSELLLKVLVI